MPTFINASKERRRDAVTRDYLTAFTIGPIGIQDPTAGTLVKAWRTRLVGNDILVAEAGPDSWINEIVLFSIADGIAVEELDLAFTQNADPAVCLQRADGNIWLYWFDPTLAAFTLTNLGTGRNPRIVLDDPFDTTDSDVQLFYISEGWDALVYRTQRERYANEHLTPLVDVADLYLDDAIRDEKLRLHLIVSSRNTVTGRYPNGYFAGLTTKLFPRFTELESVDLGGLAISGSSIIAVLVSNTDEESVDLGGRAISASSIEPFVDFAAEGSVEYGFEYSGELTEIVITRTVEVDSVDLGGLAISGSADVVITIIDDMEIESIDLGGRAISASSTVP